MTLPRLVQTAQCLQGQWVHTPGLGGSRKSTALTSEAHQVLKRSSRDVLRSEVSLSLVGEKKKEHNEAVLERGSLGSKGVALIPSGGLVKP